MKNIVQPAGQTEGNAKNKGERAAEHETKVFQVLKEIGVELSSYHGGSLHGKDINFHKGAESPKRLKNIALNAFRSQGFDT